MSGCSGGKTSSVGWTLSRQDTAKHSPRSRGVHTVPSLYSILLGYTAQPRMVWLWKYPVRCCSSKNACSWSVFSAPRAIGSVHVHSVGKPRSLLTASEKYSTRSRRPEIDRKSTRLNSSHGYISYAVF